LPLGSDMIKKLFRSKIANQFIKFCIVGFIGTAIDFGVLNLGVLVFKWNVYLAAAIAFVIAASNNFMMNKYWTFLENSKGSKAAQQYAQYLIVSAGGLLLNLGIMYILIENIHLWYNWAKVFATVMVMMWNFSLNKYWTFKAVSKEIEAPVIENKINN